MDSNVSPRDAVLQRLNMRLERLRDLLENQDEVDDAPGSVAPDPQPEAEDDPNDDDEEPSASAAMCRHAID